MSLFFNQIIKKNIFKHGLHVFTLIRYTGLPLIIRETLQRRKVTIILFHDINPIKADICFRELGKRYNIIPLEQYISARKKGSLKDLPPKSLIMTIDDGKRNNYALKELLDKHNVPITIFLCAAIVGTNKHFWFSHDMNGYNIEKLKKISNQQRLDFQKKYGFEQDKEYEDRQALSKKEIEELANKVDFQSHTLYHPILPECDDEEAYQEIAHSKELLETCYGMDISVLSYPNGDYGRREIDFAKKAGYECAITVDPGYNDLTTDLYKLKRFSIGDNSDVDELVVKASGIWQFLKNICVR